MSIIELRNIIFKQNEREILNIPSLKIEKGQIIGVIGANGAGKSTLLKTISLLNAQTAGEIVYSDEVVHSKTVSLQIRRKMSFVLQHAYLFSTTVYENVASGLKIRKLPKSDIDSKVDYWMDKLHISHLSRRHPTKLSGGEAQRVSLARALAPGPEILFLDEPFTGLDFPSKVELIKDLKKIIIENNITCFFISHDLQEIKYLTDRLLVLEKGNIIQDGETSYVIQNPDEKAGFLRQLREFTL